MLFTPEHDAIRETAKRFVEDELNPHCDEWEAAGIFPAHEVMKKAGDLGLLGISRPEKWGGGGLDYSYEMVFVEELGAVRSGGVGMAIGVQTNMAVPALSRFGSDELCEEFLRPTLAGDMVCAIGVSEPNAGSDVAAIKTSAIKDGDDYVINGQKMWITNGTQADWICLLCNTDPDGNKHTNKSLIVVPLDAKGVTRTTKIDKMGMRSSDTAIIFFDDVRVPQRYLIGEEGAGFTYQMLQFQEERIYAGGAAIKGLELVINDTIEYTQQRKTFGQPILHNQAVYFKICELMTEVEALRALTWSAVEDHINGRDATMKASMCKLKAGRLGREVTDSCLQYWGGQGFTWDNPVNRAYRDSRLTSIGGGADEIMLGIIAKLRGISPGKALS